MSDLNKTIITGRLGRDPESRDVGDTSVCNLNVAVDTSYKKGGEKIEGVTWYRVAVWGGQAGPCQRFLKKGSQVLVEGSVTARAYLKDGEAVGSLELRAQHVQFLGGKSDSTPSEAPADSNYQESGNDDDIPF